MSMKEYYYTKVAFYIKTGYPNEAMWCAKQALISAGVIRPTYGRDLMGLWRIDKGEEG